jgi:hypothetical protein
MLVITAAVEIIKIKGRIKDWSVFWIAFNDFIPFLSMIYFHYNEIEFMRIVNIRLYSTNWLGKRMYDD